jgi:zeta-carotene desaturase
MPLLLTLFWLPPLLLLLLLLLYQMGLHVFFGCYFNLFRLMAKCGVLENLLLKEHTHTFCNNDGDVRELDFRFFINGTKIGAPFHGRGTAGMWPHLPTIMSLDCI